MTNEQKQSKELDTNYLSNAIKRFEESQRTPEDYLVLSYNINLVDSRLDNKEKRVAILKGQEEAAEESSLPNCVIKSIRKHIFGQKK